MVRVNAFIHELRSMNFTNSTGDSLCHGIRMQRDSFWLVASHRSLHIPVERGLQVATRARVLLRTHSSAKSPLLSYFRNLFAESEHHHPRALMRQNEWNMSVSDSAAPSIVSDNSSDSLKIASSETTDWFRDGMNGAFHSFLTSRLQSSEFE